MAGRPDEGACASLDLHPDSLRLRIVHRRQRGRGGLKFPDNPQEPVFWDFLYFSFTIGVAAQTADVSVTSMPMRRLVLLHSAVSFFFNTTILALAVNVGASIV